ncbi:ATP synthase F0 subunit 8 (mitochondrion) [Synchiropus splendidus]|uniref:ATP synthase complex subunit 8 n=1 Tax=Synchiropus splendidus TaxID=270530 RepID=A0A060P113_SYNSL|nr:ATP synthase F0 subunit 8 [Synchiropus splendidus]BAO84814.1 ATPase subunit 8 [Synchiropus splendidus]BBU26141.1 ATPase subunit 8 [Synchiropus splendidus]
MPQLNPSPWFMILIFSWLVFLAFLPTKIMSHTYPNKLTPETKEASSNNPWTWPW